MNNLEHKNLNRSLRKLRVRSRVWGSERRPRLAVHISNRHITAQLIDDESGRTLAYVSTVGKKAASGSLSERAQWVGTEIGKKAKTSNITTVVFDRGERLYHGRVATVASSARNAGLEF